MYMISTSLTRGQYVDKEQNIYVLDMSLTGPSLEFTTSLIRA